MEPVYVPVSSPALPDGVLTLVRSAVAGTALPDVGSLVDALERGGWKRRVRSGSWQLAADPAWSVLSTDQPVGAAIFARGDLDVLRALADELGTLLDGGSLGAVRPGPPDPDWPNWHAGAVTVSYDVTPATPLGRDTVPAVLHLDLARRDTPAEGVPLDVDRARRVALEGSAVERWYLAGHDDLPDDVVDTLSRDGDPAVTSALDAGAGQRRVFAEFS